MTTSTPPTRKVPYRASLWHSSLPAMANARSLEEMLQSYYIQLAAVGVDMSGAGWVKIGEIDCEVAVYPPEHLHQAGYEILQEALRKTLVANEEKVQVLRDTIANYQAIGYSNEGFGKSSPSRRDEADDNIPF